jgi:hypothetical protein
LAGKELAVRAKDALGDKKDDKKDDAFGSFGGFGAATDFGGSGFGEVPKGSDPFSGAGGFGGGSDFGFGSFFGDKSAAPADAAAEKKSSAPAITSAAPLDPRPRPKARTRF